MKPRFSVILSVLLVTGLLLAGSVLWFRRSPELPARTLHFPADQSIGIVRVTDWGAPGSWEEVGEARGEVIIPADKWAWLILTKGDAADLSAIADLGSGDLQMLMCLDTPISDRAVDYIKRLTSLRYLSLQPSNISVEGLKELKRALPDCTFLYDRAAPTPASTPESGVH